MDNYPSNEQIEKWHNDPTKWKLGLFYFNKEDSRVLVAKNPEWMGITVNFANPKTYLALLAFVCFIGFIIYLIENQH